MFAFWGSWRWWAIAEVFVVFAVWNAIIVIVVVPAVRYSIVVMVVGVFVLAVADAYL